MNQKKIERKRHLVYKKDRKNSTTLHKHYRAYCKDNNIEYKCAIEGCPVGNTWLNKEIKLEIDHIEGVKGDNRPEKLRYLCPNCHSQQDTSGGKNKGRVETSKGGFSIKNKHGKKDYTLSVETENLSVKERKLRIKKPQKKKEKHN